MTWLWSGRTGACQVFAAAPLVRVLQGSTGAGVQRLFAEAYIHRHKRDYRTHNTAPALGARFVHEQ